MKDSDNERLLQQLFSEAAQQKIADDGFTERVMKQLPTTERRWMTARSRWFTRIWNMLCVLTFGVLFVVMDGWQQLTAHLLRLAQTLASTPLSSQLYMLTVLFAGLVVTATAEVFVRERT